jgi:hypothetical protein
MSNFMKIRPVGAELFYVDGQIDGRHVRDDEANSRFFPILRTLLTRRFTNFVTHLMAYYC